jgi:hypothetical protein
VAEIVLAFGWESTAASFRRRESSHPALAAVGYVVLGAAVGALSAWLLPYRWSQNDAISVLSVILNPIAAGFVLNYYGAARRRRKRPTTNLATFVGGMSFAFGLSLARFLLLVVWKAFEA